jgi:hypothetical protein
MSRYLYSSDMLPVGFQFPQSFLAHVASLATLDVSPWQFLFRSQKDADGRMLAVKRLYPTRSLVPFAHWDGSDDVACFDGDDRSGDPAVHLVHFYATAGWEDRGQVGSFDEWLKVAEQQSADFRAQVEE